MRTTSGADWIWTTTRLAIYARDGWRCVACGREPGEARLEKLSLDHVRPTCRGGSNKPSNLITLCVSCNGSRGASPISRWRPDLVAVVRRLRRRKLDRVAARKLAGELRPGRFIAKALRDARRFAPHPVTDLPF